MPKPEHDLRHLPIYETSLSASTASGKFSEFKERLPALQKMGIGIIWFLPLFPRGGNPPGKPPSDSPYCVRDYFDVDPRYGTKADFKHLIQAIHAHGMFVIMDNVPNHSAWGNPLIHEHPEFYKKNAQGEIEYPEPWTDVAKLDYSNKALWEYMARVHEYWIREFDIDGFREDVAGDVPLEFWMWLRPRMNAIKPVFWLAEAEGPELLNAFDTDYDWTLQAYAYMIAKGDWPAHSLDKMLAEEHARYPKKATRMRHLDNHDMTYMGYAWGNRDHLDPSMYPYLESTNLREKYGPGRHAFTTLTATLPNSQPMIWNGEEIGILDLTPDPIHWTESEDRAFYTRLFAAYRQSKALREGTFRKLSTSADDFVYAFERECGPSKSIVVLNLSKASQSVKIEGVSGNFREVFSGKPAMFSHAEVVNLSPWDYRLFVNVVR